MSVRLGEWAPTEAGALIRDEWGSEQLLFNATYRTIEADVTHVGSSRWSSGDVVTSWSVPEEVVRLIRCGDQLQLGGRQVVVMAVDYAEGVVKVSGIRRVREPKTRVLRIEETMLRGEPLDDVVLRLKRARALVLGGKR